jgi:site-specific DNA-methyltransferase (cytosine-N4-specific)
MALILGLDREQRKAIEDRLVGSREITIRERSQLEVELASGSDERLPHSTVAFLIGYQTLIASHRESGFRLRNAPAVLARYFKSIASVFAQLSIRMSPGSSAWFVIGDSRSKVGSELCVIPTVAESVVIAEAAGFELVEAIPVTVSREDMLHSRNTITRNEALHFVRG